MSEPLFTQEQLLRQWAIERAGENLAPHGTAGNAEEVITYAEKILGFVTSTSAPSA